LHKLKLRLAGGGITPIVSKCEGSHCSGSCSPTQSLHILLTEEIKQHQTTNNKQKPLEKKQKQLTSSCLIISAYRMSVTWISLRDDFTSLHITS
jgi:hypothetical protein